MERHFHVYILASWSRVIYVGVTNDLIRRVHEHQQRKVPSFTRDYSVNKLVYFEDCGDADAAITREKQLKSRRREKKVRLIEKINPKWLDLTPEIEAHNR